MVYFQCGRIGHSEDECGFLEDSSGSGKAEVRGVPNEVVIKEGEGSKDRLCSLVQEPSGSDGGSWPKLGPWLVNSRVRQPRAPKALMRGRKDQDK